MMRVMMEKGVRVFQRFSRGSRVTLREIDRCITMHRNRHPEYDLYFDGDLYAICGRRRA